ncbi:glutamate 5-kinase [Firmicutes bacterium CAG:536]|nr:glutamate 5-kinase [Firmicutes bacterium CAG:536]
MRDFSHVKNMIVKIGSSSLCNAEGNIDTEKFSVLLNRLPRFDVREFRLFW